MIGPASSRVVQGSAIAWSALLAGLQLSGVATRGVLCGQGSGKPLSAVDRLRWNARLVSTAHAVVLVIGAPTTACATLLAIVRQTVHQHAHQSVAAALYLPSVTLK